MKIFGDRNSSKFKNYDKESGFFFGHNDVLKGTKRDAHHYSISYFGTSYHLKTVEPKLYLHIPTNAWTTFTGKLREYFLPWRWKTAYLDQEDGTRPRQILVCTSVHDGELSDRISDLLGKSLFLTSLIDSDHYYEIFGQEFIGLKGENSQRWTKITHPLGEIAGVQYIVSNDFHLFCHIYRRRGLFSRFKYNLLKRFSSSWKEVAIQSGHVSEKILINKSDEQVISRSGLNKK